MAAVARLFPAYTEADWRKAAEAALKGASLETLTRRLRTAFGSNPSIRRRKARGRIRPAGPWRITRASIIPMLSEANAQALDDLANGADGLQVVFSGALGAYGFGLRRFDSAALHKAFDGVRFNAGASFELDLGPEGPDQALRFGALIERSGARPEDCGSRSGSILSRCRPADSSPPIGALKRAALWRLRLRLRDRGFAGPFLVADARAVHAAGGSPAQELGLRARGRRQRVAAVRRDGNTAWGSPRADRVPFGGRRGRIGDNVEIPRACASPGRAWSKPAASSLERLMCRRKAPGA